MTPQEIDAIARATVQAAINKIKYELAWALIACLIAYLFTHYS